MNTDLAGNRRCNCFSLWLIPYSVHVPFSLCFQFLTGLLLTVLTDIIHVSVFYPPNNYLTDVKRFSIGMAIFSLLLKPLSCYLVYRMYRERGGEYTFNLGRMLPLPPCQCSPPPVLGLTALYFGTLQPELRAAKFCLLSKGGVCACSFSLSYVCSPFLWSWCVLGLKFTFFLSSLADMESSSDSHFAHNGIVRE